MRQTIVAGNWKLNGNTESISALVGQIREQIGATGNKVLVCAPYVYLPMVAGLLRDCSIALGSQDISSFDAGAYTGEVSGSMLKDVGCDYAIVGHSERRSLFGEDSAQVAAKFKAAQYAGLTPILCIGETLEQRDAGQTEKVVADQLEAVINAAGIQAMTDAIVAYEPVWAIGTGRTATPEQAQAVHDFLRKKVAMYSAEVSETLPILYGGSVNADNAADLFAQTDIDGGLIGGASLKVKDFLAICSAE